MNWLKENPFLAGLAAITLIGAGVLGFMVFGQAMPNYEATAEAYGQAVRKLHELQGRVPFPSAENLTKSKAITEQYRVDLQALHQKLAAMESPLSTNIGPQQFQDSLRQAVNEITENAEKAGVTLPADFYLGFRQYANNLPAEQATPALARQLTVIKAMVQRLIDFKVHSIDRLDRMPLPQELGGASAANAGGNAPGNRPEGGRRDRQGGGGNKVLVEKFPLELAFTAEQSKFRVAFNSLMGADQFLIVRSLTVRNSNPAGPPVEEANAASSTASEEQAKNLNVILGRELVQVTLRIEMLDFANTLPEAK